MGFGVADGFEVDFVEGFEAVELGAAEGLGHARGVVDEEDGVAAGAEGDPGVFAWEVACGPEACGDGLHLFAVSGFGDEDDEGREVLVHGSEAIA